MSFQIRPAVPADAPAIAHVQTESWRTTYKGIVPDTFLAAMNEEARTESWRPQLADAAIRIFVACDETGVIGFVTGGPIRDPAEDYDAELYAIYLLQQNQLRGAGRALVRTLAASLHAQCLKKMLVWALEANPSVEFYKRLGAIPVTTKTIHIGGKDLSDLALGWTSLSSLL